MGNMEQGLRLLILEDVAAEAELAAHQLKRAGLTCTWTRVETEEAFREALHELRPDLILLDMLLPKLGGPEVLRALKNDPITAQIPVVVLSSLSQMNEAKFIKDGAAAYFEKSKLRLDADSQALLEIVKVAMAQ